MTEINETITIDAPAEEVWAPAGDPGRIAEWLPFLETSSTEKGERMCTTKTGDRVVDRIVERSDEERYYEYEIVESPMPLRSYRSRLAIDGHGDHSHVAWTATFATEDPGAAEELEETFRGLYREGLEGLRDAVEAARAG
jgi:uncharacterized protein YndB with AHSA1/START domain